GARRSLKQVADPIHAGAPPPAPSGAPRALRLQQVDAREHALESPEARRPGGIDRAPDSRGQGLAARDLFPARWATRQMRGHRVAVPTLEGAVHVPGHQLRDVAMKIGLAHPGISSELRRRARPSAVRSGASRLRAWNIRVFTVFTGARVISAISSYAQP